LNLLEKAHKAGAVSADRMSQAMGHLQEKYKQGATASVGGVSAVNELKSTLAQYAGMAAAFAGVKKSLSLAATAESNKISLEVLTGSAAKAQMLFEGFIDLDRSSPLSRSDFSRASQTLIGYGFAAESTLPALKALSEVSIGNADRFQSLSLAFGQVTANGRLMGQEVLQMVNAGFNPLQEISRTTGRSMIDLKKDMENGAISAKMVEDAFQSATSEGGRFFEMNERLKNSAAGQWAKMQSDIELLATEIGTNLMPAAKAFMDLLNTGADSKGEGGMFASLAKAFSTGAEGIMAIGSDAFTNLDGNSKGTKFSSLQDKLQTEQMTKQMQIEAGVHVQTKEERERVAAAIAKRQAKEREELEAIAKKEKEIADAKEAAAKLESDKQKKAQKEADAAFEKMIKDAETLKEKARSPFAEYILEFERLQDLFNEGFIDEATFEKQSADSLDKANKKATKEKKGPDDNNVDLATTQSLRAGSVEAYKFLMDQKNEEMEVALRQAELQEIQVELNKQQLEAIKEIQPIGRAR
jgi:tape measure domain-containing protein